MQKLEFRIHEFPMVIGRYPVHPTKEDVDTAFKTMTQLARRGRFIVIADLTAMDHRHVTPELRAAFYDKANQFNAEAGDALIAEAVVIANPVLRLFHQAYLWMTPSRGRPCRVFAKVIDAEHWCRELLESE